MRHSTTIRLRVSLVLTVVAACAVLVTATASAGELPERARDAVDSARKHIRKSNYVAALPLLERAAEGFELRMDWWRDWHDRLAHRGKRYGQNIRRNAVFFSRVAGEQADV